MYFDDFLTRLKKGEEPRLVLLFGESEGVISEGFQLLKDNFRKAKPGGTIQIFEGGEGTLADLLSAAQTTSLFSSAQLLVLKHAEKSIGGRSDEPLKQLKEYNKNPNPDSCLVFLAPGMKKSAKVTAIEAVGWAVQCSDIPDWKMIPWLKDQAQAKGLSLKDDGAQLLVQKIGSDMSYLQRALEQLSLYVYPRKSATLEEVKNLPVPGFESEIFPFIDAVGMRQTEKALTMLGRLRDGVDAGTVILLYMRIRELLMIAQGRARGWNQQLVAEKLGLNPYRLKMVWDQSSQFTAAELKEALLDLIHLQAGVVTGRLGKNVPAVSLEWWILKWGKNRMAAAKAAIR